jgi:sporulation protein YlmC with PRC-barrel domain
MREGKGEETGAGQPEGDPEAIAAPPHDDAGDPEGGQNDTPEGTRSGGCGHGEAAEEPGGGQECGGHARHAGMLASRRYRWGMDEGAPVAYEVLEDGVPAYASDGTQIGTVDHVVAAPEEDIFHGLVIRTPAGRRFVAAEKVSALHERGADLRISAEEVTNLPAPHGGNPELEVKDPDARTSPGKWKEIVDMVRLKGYLSADWSDEE